jgi:putative ABC transport system permease protein
MWPRLRSLWRNTVHRRRADRDLEDEIAVAFDLAVDEEIRRGVDPDRARRQAMLQFGRPIAIASEVRERRAGAAVEILWKDVAFGGRLLRRTPLFALTAMVSLALGIGATTTIFTLVNALLLRDLRVGHPEQLVEISRVTPYGRGGSFSYPIYRTLRDNNTVFNGMVAVSRSLVQADLDTTPAPIGRIVSENFFEVLQVPPQLGRVIAPSDADSGAAIAVLSHAFWQRQFGAAPAAIGQSLLIQKASFTIVGVLPESFDDPAVWRAADFYIPMASEPRIRRQSWLNRPDFNWLAMVGRLGPGGSIAASQASLDPIFGRFLEDHSRTMSEAQDRKNFLSHRIVLESARAGLSDLRRQFSRPILLLMTAVTLVLLIACMNVVNLLLARGVGRRREMALRLAIGASRGRLIRQMLTESTLLGLAGGAAGFVLSLVGVPLLVTLVSDGPTPVDLHVDPDGRVLLFTIAVAVGASIVAGLMPAVRTARVEIASDFDASPRTLSTARGSTRWSQVLIAAQVALSLLLLIGAALILTSLRNMRTFDAGFDREHVLLVGLTPERAGYTGERLTQYFREILGRVRALPGVRAAGLAAITPVSGGGIDLSFAVEDRPGEPPVAVYVNIVSDGFMGAMGTTIRRGRDFTPQDGRGAPVALINEALAQRFFKDEDPLGRRVRLGPQTGVEIIGIVANAKYMTLREQDKPTIYSYALNREASMGLQLTVGTAADSAALVAAVRREVQSVDAAVRVQQPRTFSAHLDQSLVTERLMARLLGGFAMLALLLAAVGLYGVLGYSVARRTGEIGLRLALGASRATVLRAVLRESAVLVAIGAAVGVPAALLLSRTLASLLFDVTPSDPRILAGSVVCLFAVAMLAAAVPAWRASRVEPLMALRQG